jgi:hypothetical protein
MEVDSSLLQKWLHSGDPRLIAWSADFARRRHDSQIISEIPGVLEHLSMPPVAGGHEEQAPRRRAALALVDTLIQENAQVALPVIELVARMFPAQSKSSSGELEGNPYQLGFQPGWYQPDSRHDSGQDARSGFRLPHT